MVRKKTLSLSISLGTYEELKTAILLQALANKSCYVCVANAHMIVEAKNSSVFAQIVNKAEIVTPDGKPLTWALNILHGVKQERVAGMDLLPDLLYSAMINSISVFFYGGTPFDLSQTEKFVTEKYPTLSVAGLYSPPFRDLTCEEEENIAFRINNSSAKLIFVALGCPKQEKWMARMQGKINGVMIGIGGALPVLIGVQKRAPVWMQKIGLEWLYRLKQEPRRLFKRYATTNFSFIWMLGRAWLNKSLMKKVESDDFSEQKVKVSLTSNQID